MISGLFKKGKKGNNALGDLFSKPIKEVKAEEKVEQEVPVDLRQEGDEKLSAMQLKERDERTIFIGNVDLELGQKELKKAFKEFGTIEKVWFRSVPTEESKLPQKASVILKKYNKNAIGKNAYMLFSKKEEAEAALEMNSKKIKNNHLRVDTAIRQKHDYTKTLFIGNLAFDANEEEVRELFSGCGKIVDIRIVRDKKTHVGKGIAYITFGTVDAMKAALKLKSISLKNRELRVKKAVAADRLEKKQKKKAAAIEAKAKARAEYSKRKVNKEDLVKEKDMTALLEDADMKGPDIEDMNLVNEIKTSAGAIKKRIKKVRRRDGEEADTFREVQITKKKTKAKMDREIFNGKNEMAIRRKKRKIREMLNKKRLKLQRKQEKALHQ